MPCPFTCRFIGVGGFVVPDYVRHMIAEYHRLSDGAWSEGASAEFELRCPGPSGRRWSSAGQHEPPLGRRRHPVRIIGRGALELRLDWISGSPFNSGLGPEAGSLPPTGSPKLASSAVIVYIAALCVDSNYGDLNGFTLGKTLGRGSEKGA
jgi:hypothetical protein